MRTAWSQPLKLTFVALQLSGIHMLGVAFFLGTLIWWAFINFLDAIFSRPSTSYWDTTIGLLGSTLDKFPWLLVVGGAAVLASVFLTYGAYRSKAWAHWGAMAFIALSVAPPLLLEPLRDFLGALAWVYSAACLSCVAAMALAAIRYGPWGMTKPVEH